MLLKLQKDQVNFDGDTSTMSENGRAGDLLIRSYDYKSKINQSAPKYTGNTNDLIKKSEQKRHDMHVKF